MFKYSIIAIFLSSVFCNSLQGQVDHSYVDSLTKVIPSLHDTSKVKKYLDIFKACMNYDLKTAGLYADSMVMTAEKTSNKDILAGAYNVKGMHLNMIAIYSKSADYFQKAHDLYVDIGKDSRANVILNNISSSYMSMGNLDGALAIQMKALKYHEEHNIKGDPLGANYWTIGTIYNELEQHEESNKWYRKARKIFAELGDDYGVDDLDLNITSNLTNLDSMEVSEAILLKLEQKLADKKNFTDIVSVYEQLGDIYIAQRKYALAEQYLDKGLKYALSNGEQDAPGYIYRDLTELHLATNDLQKARKYAELSLQISEDYDRYKRKITDFQLLSDIHKGLGDYEEALSYYTKYDILHDSLLGIEKQKVISDLKTKYETEKKEQEIKLLEEKAKRNSLERKGMIGGIVALLSLLSALLYAMRQRATKNKVEKQKIEQELAFNIKELDLKKQELTAYALQLASKNQVLEGIKSNVNEIKIGNESNRDLQKIVNTIDINQNDDESWEGFRSRFLAVHKDFEVDVKSKFPAVTINELRLMALLKMQLTSKEIANILNISGEGIKKARYRLRKKLGLEKTDSLEELVLSI